MKRLLMIVLALTLLLAACSGPVIPTSPSLGGHDIIDDDSGSGLKRSASYAELIKIFLKAQNGRQYNYRDFYYAGGALAEDSKSAQSSDRNNADYSQTNVQIEGVDEADIIKTDGEYLYLIANNRLYIVDVHDPANLKLLSSTVFNMNEQTGNISRGENPITMYLDVETQRLILIVSGYISEQIPVEIPTEPNQTEQPTVSEIPPVSEEPTKPAEPAVSETTGSPDGSDGSNGVSVGSDGTGADETQSADQPADVLSEAVAPDQVIRYDPYYYIYNFEQYTTTYVYDLADRSAPMLVRQFTQTGYYLDSRKIGNNVYVITNDYANLYRGYPVGAEDSADEPRPEDIFPSITSKIGTINLDDFKTLPAGQITILPDGDVNNQLIIAGINTQNDGLEPNLLAVLGTSGTIFCSESYLYVAAYNYPWLMYAATDSMVKSSGSADSSPEYVEVTTDIYRFRLSDGTISEAGVGSVPGSIINQFSMDEYQGFFRIATTTGESWTATGERAAKNNVYVLNDSMRVVGQVTGLALGETIKSVRFMGDQAYVVTFRTVDPLFVIDLANPSDPHVLGQLKIPGYSTYLHPYDENKLLGFGFDVKVEGDNAYNGGLKVSMFDIADFANPREISTIVLGGRGSYSELLYGHKALLFSREKNLIAFPAMLYEKTQGVHDYGNPSFQGLLVLSVNADNQLELRGSVTHFARMSDPDGEGVALNEKEWNAFWGYDMITRGAYVGNTIFTLSNRQIQATALDSLTTVGAVELPGYEEAYRYYYGIDTKVAE